MTKLNLEIFDKMDTPGDKFKKLRERLMGQLEFADHLSGLSEHKDKKWGELVYESQNAIKDELDGNEKNMDSLTKKVEEILEPIGEYAKEFHIHCVGHAHIDMNWLWPWSETVATVNDTFITILKLMEEFPDFCYSQSQGAVYEIIKKFNPGVFEEIKKRVAEGRWEITASQWVEGDKNLPSGESIIRHMLYTRAYMEDNFGLKPEDISIAWEPDTFGHAVSIPALMLGGGVTRYHLGRGGEEELPPLFIWRAPDGSEIIVNCEQTWYNDPLGTHNINGLLHFHGKSKLKEWMLVFGVGDHGGGPTRRDLKMFEEMRTWPIFPDFKFSTTNKFFSRIEEKKDILPVIEKELNFEFPGCYVSKTPIKSTNRLAENILEEAETAAVLAELNSDYKYPHEELKDAWLSTLFGQFHDILPGCGIPATTHSHCAKYQETAATSGMIKTNALRMFTANIDTKYFAKLSQQSDSTSTSMGAGAGVETHNGGVSAVNHSTDELGTFTVFNPSAWERREIVFVKVWDSENHNVKKKTFTAFFPDGSNTPAHRIKDGILWDHGFVELAVPVNVNALGYTSFAIMVTGEIHEYPYGAFGYPDFDYFKNQNGGNVVNLAKPRNICLSYTGEFGMENDNLKVLFDRDTGGIKKLIDKESDVDFVPEKSDMLSLEYTLERAEGMSAWKIHPPKKEPAKLTPVSFKPVLMNSSISSYEATFKIANSEIILTYSLKSDSPYLELKLTVNWFEIGNDSLGIPGLRISFHTAIHDCSGVYEIPLGSIIRNLNNGEVVPTQKWSTVHGQLKNGDKSLEGGFMILNDSLYNSFLKTNTLGLYLIRSTYEPDPVPEVGQHEFRIALQPYIGEMKRGLYIKSGMAFNNSLIPLSTDIHSGELPPASPDMISAHSDNIIISHIKKSEDGNALIVRLQETEGRAGEVAIRLSEILTEKITNAFEVDFLEREKNAILKINSNTLTLKIFSFEIKNLKLIIT